MYSKTTRTAMAAMTLLAETWDDGETLLAAIDIAEERDLELPFLRKILTQLAQAGLVESIRGRGGGFVLARPPKRIKLSEVIDLFESPGEPRACPFGAGECGTGPNCPLHDWFAGVRKDIAARMRRTTFEVYREG